MSDLFIAGKIKLPGWDQLYTPDPTARWKALCDLEFKPSYMDEMDQLSHHERIPLIWHWYVHDQVSADELNRLLSENWTHGGYIGDLGVEIHAVVEMLEIAGYITDSPEAPSLSDPVTLYRGCRPEATRGLSWSLDPNCAAWFAWRLHEQSGINAVVCQAVVPSYAILGRFEGRFEREVLVDTGQIESSAIITIPAKSLSVERGFHVYMLDRTERGRELYSDDEEGRDLRIAELKATIANLDARLELAKLTKAGSLNL